MGFTHRIATLEDLAALRALMHRAIEQLQDEFLTPEQVAASHKVMGLDSQLITDGTYFVIEDTDEHATAGCGGWSFRKTLYGGDNSVVERAPQVLDPATDAAKVRAMYTDPAYSRRGVGKLLLGLCEAAAHAAGFRRVELMATMSGVPLYRAAGYQPVQEVTSAPIEGVTVPLLLMEKILVPYNPF
ncbi:GNAT family N-acetyltransferase [Sphingomonas sp. GlSt437]|uniref:GNAT family N-acetyltransferase n=1 Tax=Sphingomonas sp. GlSt437 TaxID=3389970 RepID=UPI003A89F979